MFCEVVDGGLLGEHQGINLPGAVLSVPSLTAKDKKDLAFGLSAQVDVVAISFVRSAADIRAVKKIIAAAGTRYAGHRQAGKAPGHRKSRRDSADCRRRDGGARRPRRGSSARKGSHHPEAHHPPRPAMAQAGYHRDPDAGFDDPESPPHPRRGQRRGQRHLRWLGRGHALGRNRQRTAPLRGRQHDGAHRGRGRSRHPESSHSAPPRNSDS